MPAMVAKTGVQPENFKGKKYSISYFQKTGKDPE